MKNSAKRARRQPLSLQELSKKKAHEQSEAPKYGNFACTLRGRHHGHSPLSQTSRGSARSICRADTRSKLSTW